MNRECMGQHWRHGGAIGTVSGRLSILTNADGTHEIEGNLLEGGSSDFAFTTNSATFLTYSISAENYSSIAYRANGHWEKIANVSVPASLPLLLGGVGALAALRRKRRAIATEGPAV